MSLLSERLRASLLALSAIERFSKMYDPEVALSRMNTVMDQFLNVLQSTSSNPSDRLDSLESLDLVDDVYQAYLSSIRSLYPTPADGYTPLAWVDYVRSFSPSFLERLRTDSFALLEAVYSDGAS